MDEKNIARMFDHYEDPRKARKVVEEYFPRFRERLLIPSSELNQIIRGYNEIDDLDLALDRLATNHELPSLGRGTTYTRIDESSGSASNALRDMEDR